MAYSRVVVCAAVSAGLFAAAAPAAAAQIDWEVENRFPLFRKAEQFRKIAEVYRSLPAAERSERPTLALERELERRALDKTMGSAFGEPSALAKFGWASALARETCFDPGSKSYRGCRTDGETYATMTRTNLVATLKEGPLDGICQWSVNGENATSVPCAAPEVTLPRVPISGPIEIAVRKDGEVVADLSGPGVEARVVVGFGDSFASGEGNPDRPANLGLQPDSYNKSSRGKGLGYHTKRLNDLQWYPLRKSAPIKVPRSSKDYAVFGNEIDAALWLNSQCHRSLYSQQLKAALTLALEHRRALIRFFGYACTGAEVRQGLLDYWPARSDLKKKERDDSPQLMRLLRDHCGSPKDYEEFLRPPKFAWRDLKPCESVGARVDAVLLDVGGNDIGFSKVIANEFLLETNPVYYAWKKVVGPISFQTAKANFDRLKPLFAELAKALEVKAGVEAAKVIQTVYPQVAKLSDRENCGVGRIGLDAHAIFSLSKAATGTDSVEFVAALNARIKQDAPWRTVDDFVPSFTGHAICARGDEDSSAKADGMVFPKVFTLNAKWTEFRPDQWAPYQPWRRWFVTPNDAFLSANYMTLGFPANGIPRDVLQPLLASTYGGAFHPNALGHAAIADGVLPTLRKTLSLPAP